MSVTTASQGTASPTRVRHGTTAAACAGNGDVGPIGCGTTKNRMSQGCSILVCVIDTSHCVLRRICLFEAAYPNHPEANGYLLGGLLVCYIMFHRIWDDNPLPTSHRSGRRA